MLYTFVVGHESHTLGNLVAERVLIDGVEFASYRVPHPLSTDVHISIDAPELQAARRSLVSACDGLLEDVRGLRRAVCDTDQLDAPLPEYAVRVRSGVPLRDEDMR